MIAAVVISIIMRTQDFTFEHPRTVPTGNPTGNPTTNPTGEHVMTDAEWQRSEAFAYCAIQKYADCLVWLDRAKAKDPDGETTPRVQVARIIAEQAIAQQKKEPR